MNHYTLFPLHPPLMNVESWVFRDVVFQDVGFENTRFKTPHPYQL